MLVLLKADEAHARRARPFADRTAEGAQPQREMDGDGGGPEPRRRTGYSLRPGFHGDHTIGDGTGGCAKGRMR